MRRTPAQPALISTEQRKPTELTICHQNIRCITNKTKQLEVLLTKELTCDLIIITEHWLRKHELTSVTLCNFDLLSFSCRKLVAHGGSCIYARSGLLVVNRQDYCDLTQEHIFDVCAVHLLDDDILVVGVYHSNGTSHSDYLDLFEMLLCKITDEGIDCVIMGDTNIDLLDSSSAQKQLVDLLDSFNFRQLVDQHTRTDVGGRKSLLDHVYTNMSAKRVTGVTNVDTRPLSDHKAQRFTLARHVAVAPAPAHRLGRSFSEANELNFINALESVDWDRIVEKSNDCCHSLASGIVYALSNKFNICFPIKNQLERMKHWVDAEVHNFKHLLQETIRLKKRFPMDDRLRAKCDELTGKYHSLLKEKRVRHYSKVIQKNPRCMWRVINSELGRGTHERVDFTDLVRDTSGQTFGTKKDVVDALNLEFVTAASGCGAPAANSAMALAALGARKSASDVSIRMEPFTPFEVYTIATKRIAPKKSTDIYGLSASVLKTAIGPVAHVLCHLFNSCMREGIYPASLKKVKICPLYKGKGKKADPKSYRPISLVPAVSKVFEVGLNRRIMNFLVDRNSLSDRQYAYRAGRATTDMVREVVWRVLSARESRLQVALLCCDLSRAFDTADHSLVADKLQVHGFRGPALSILTSFMSQRTQVVVGDRGRVESTEMENVMGVPQGSCLSNTKFSLLLNDLPDAIDDAEIYMYADDVAAVIMAPTHAQLESKLNSVVNKLDGWFKSNGLALNRDKTCFMAFNLNGHMTKTYSVAIGQTALQQVPCTKLLGFHLDSALTWETHVEELCKKLAGSCFALRRLASTATRSVVRTCYFATVHSVITYGLELWGRAADRNRAFAMQKRAVRAICGVQSDVSCVELFRELQILPLPCELIYQVALFTHTHLDAFQRRGVHSTMNLRSNVKKAQLVTPSHRLVKSERSVYILGPAIYNRLPASIRDAPSTACFKTKLRAWLLELLFYKIEDFFKE